MRPLSEWKTEQTDGDNEWWDSGASHILWFNK